MADAKNIFMIGPASVGKTTTGRILAALLGRRFIDIDYRFCEQIELIPRYIDQFGYPAYCQANSQLVDSLLSEFPSNTILATPAGFLAHEDSPELVRKHLSVIASGVSVVLLPSTEVEAGVEVVVERQLARYPELDADSERERFKRRFYLYRDKGDIQVVTNGSPTYVANHIVRQLVAYDQRQGVNTV
jgi:shikimate kinase